MSLHKYLIGLNILPRITLIIILPRISLPISALLLILVAEIMAISIRKNQNVQGIIVEK